MKSIINEKLLDAEILLEILGNKMPIEDEARTLHKQTYGCYYIDNKWTYNAYINRLNRFIADNNLGANIQIERIWSPLIIEEDGSEYYVKNKIIVQNLNIQSKRNFGVSFEQLGISESFPEGSILSRDEYKGGLYIEFRNNLFTHDTNFKGNPLINIGMSDYARLSFKNNVFENVDVNLDANYNNCFVHFINNKFFNRHITLVGVHEKVYPAIGRLSSNGYGIKVEVQSRLFNSRRLKERLNEIDFPKDAFPEIKSRLNEKITTGEVRLSDVLAYFIHRDNKLALCPEDIDYIETRNAILSFRDNEINSITVGGKRLYFFGKNKIKKISTSAYSEYLYYGPYNILDKERQFDFHHKTIFIALKEDAIRRKDRTQELVFNREVLRFEQSLLKKERKSFVTLKDKSRKDRFILTFNRVSNNYGLDWTRSVYCMLIVNLIFCLPFFGVNYSFSDSTSDILNTIGMFFEFLIPTKSIGSVTGLKHFNKIWEAFNLVKNVFIAAFIYQALNAFRRYKNT